MLNIEIQLLNQLLQSIEEGKFTERDCVWTHTETKTVIKHNWDRNDNVIIHVGDYRICPTQSETIYKALQEYHHVLLRDRLRNEEFQLNRLLSSMF